MDECVCVCVCFVHECESICVAFSDLHVLQISDNDNAITKTIVNFIVKSTFNTFASIYFIR